MLFASRLAIFLLYSFCISVPASSLLASKPRLEIVRPKIINRMADTRLAVDLVVPASTSIVKVNKKALISTIITASYMSIIVSVMALPVCLSAISADIAFYGAKTKSSYLSEVIFAATIAIVSTIQIISLFLHWFEYVFGVGLRLLTSQRYMNFLQCRNVCEAAVESILDTVAILAVLCSLSGCVACQCVAF